jgi:pyruvate/2-oxoglutarate dehydrogenase complex dihydrolipoamide acyltransferase (E2) component
MGLSIVIERWAENLDEATVGKWLKQEGDPIAVGDAVVEIITDKATFEWEAEEAGVLRKTWAADKSVVPVGYVIGFIGTPDEALPDVEDSNAALLADREASGLELTLDPAPQSRAPGAPRKRIPATPAARRRAREADVSIEEVAAALGVEGRISEDDVERFLARPQA